MDDRPQRNDVGRDLVKTLRDERDLADIAATLAEISIDDLLDDGLAKNIPIIKAARSALKAYTSYRDYLLIRKLLTFLVSLESVPHDQRASQVDQLACDEKERSRLGENLMLLLDRLDDISKPKMLANAWSAYLQQRINRDQLLDLHHAIDRVRMPDLPVLIDTYLGRIGFRIAVLSAVAGNLKIPNNCSAVRRQFRRKPNDRRNLVTIDTIVDVRIV